MLLNRPSQGFELDFFVRVGEIIACSYVLKLGGLRAWENFEIYIVQLLLMASETTYKAKKICFLIIVIGKFQGGGKPVRWDIRWSPLSK